MRLAARSRDRCNAFLPHCKWRRMSLKVLVIDSCNWSICTFFYQKRARFLQSARYLFSVLWQKGDSCSYQPPYQNISIFCKSFDGHANSFTLWESEMTKYVTVYGFLHLAIPRLLLKETQNRMKAHKWVLAKESFIIEMNSKWFLKMFFLVQIRWCPLRRSVLLLRHWN